MTDGYDSRFAWEDEDANRREADAYPKFDLLAPKRLQDCLSSPPGAFSGYQEVWDQVLCCLCFGMFYHDELQPVTEGPSKHWDVCVTCAEAEIAAGASY